MPRKVIWLKKTVYETSYSTCDRDQISSNPVRLSLISIWCLGVLIFFSSWYFNCLASSSSGWPFTPIHGCTRVKCPREVFSVGRWWLFHSHFRLPKMLFLFVLIVSCFFCVRQWRAEKETVFGAGEDYCYPYFRVEGAVNQWIVIKRYIFRQDLCNKYYLR